MKIQHENVWDTAKVVLKGTFIAINEYVRREGKPQINNLSSCLKKLKEEQQNQPKANDEGSDKDKRRNQ